MKTIPLTRGLVALVDDCDFERLSKFKWCVAGRKPRLCAMAYRGKKSRPYMHRMVMNAPDGVDVDHVNHNTLDNRKRNLRLATRAQNNQNSAGRRAASGYKCVYFDKGRQGSNKWRAYITILGRLTHLGRFSTATEAAIAYNNAAKKAFGEFAYLNKIS